LNSSAAFTNSILSREQVHPTQPADDVRPERVFEQIIGPEA